MAIFITLVYMYPLIIVDYCEFIIIFAFDAVAQSPPGNAREKNLIITSCVTHSIQSVTPNNDHAYSKKACHRNKVLTRGLLCRFCLVLLALFIIKVLLIR